MPQEEKNTAEKAKKFGGLHACMRPYSMEARGELVSTYMAVLLVGLIFGILGFLLWGERADLSLFRTTWVQTRAFSAYESGGAFMRFFIQWFFHYEWGLLLLLAFSFTLFSPLLCGAFCLWRGICVGYSCAMLAGSSFSFFFVLLVAFLLALSVLYVMAACKSVWFFRQLIRHLQKGAGAEQERFWAVHTLPLGISFLLLSATLSILLIVCSIVAQLMLR